MLIYNLIDIIYILSEKDMSIELRTINILRLYHYIYIYVQPENIRFSYLSLVR